MLSLDIIDKDILDLETNHDTTWATVERLAWLYIVRANLNGNAPSVQATPLEVSGTTDFLKAVEDKNSVKVFDVIDELMDVIKVTNERLYNSVMRKIDEIE
jgi:hypothetical protein